MNGTANEVGATVPSSCYRLSAIFSQTISTEKKRLTVPDVLVNSAKTIQVNLSRIISLGSHTRCLDSSVPCQATHLGICVESHGPVATQKEQCVADEKGGDLDDKERCDERWPSIYAVPFARDLAHYQFRNVT
jgi:hypothetical protein